MKRPERKKYSSSSSKELSTQQIQKYSPDKKEEIRLNKFLASAGVCSRREADVLIEKGLIKVNGNLVTTLGTKVYPSDKVAYNGEFLTRQSYIYVLLNKPKDYITTMDDPRDRKTVMDLVQGSCNERIYPVGRLDRQTTGLLLFTNDGATADRLSHPSNNIKKIYQVDLNKPIAQVDFEKLQKGLTLEDGPVTIDDVAILDKAKTILGLEIHIGRPRIVRRIFEHLGYDVIRLDRVMYATLTKKNLPRRKWRYLTEKEVINLKNLGKKTKKDEKIH